MSTSGQTVEDWIADCWQEVEQLPVKSDATSWPKQNETPRATVAIVPELIKEDFSEELKNLRAKVLELEKVQVDILKHRISFMETQLAICEDNHKKETESLRNNLNALRRQLASTEEANRVNIALINSLKREIADLKAMSRSAERELKIPVTTSCDFNQTKLLQPQRTNIFDGTSTSDTKETVMRKRQLSYSSSITGHIESQISKRTNATVSQKPISLTTGPSKVAATKMLETEFGVNQAPGLMVDKIGKQHVRMRQVMEQTRGGHHVKSAQQQGLVRGQQGGSMTPLQLPNGHAGLSESNSTYASPPEDISAARIAITSSSNEYDSCFQPDWNDELTVIGSPISAVDVSFPGSYPLCKPYRHLATFDGHIHNVYGLVCTPDNRLVSASYDCSIRVWNASTRKCVNNYSKCHTKGITCLLILGNGNLVTGGVDNCIKQWACDSHECLSSISDAHNDYVYRLAKLSYGRVMSGGGDNDKTIKIWDLTTCHCQMVIEGHAGGIRAILELKDGRIASGSWDNTIRLTSLVATTTPCTSLSNDGSSALHQQSSSSIESSTRVVKGHPGTVYALAQIGSGYLASGSGDKLVRLWNVNPDVPEGQELIREMKGHTGSVICLCILADNVTLVSGSHDCTVRLWDTSQGLCLQILTGHVGYVNCLTVLPDGVTMASGSYDHTIRLWGL